jgi:hypothetical protein
VKVPQGDFPIDGVRQGIIFLLGVVLVVYAVFETGPDLSIVIVGLILIGLVPADMTVTKLLGGRSNGKSSDEPPSPES